MIGITATAALSGFGLFGLVGGVLLTLVGLVVGGLAHAASSGSFKDGFSIEKLGDSVMRAVTGDGGARIDLSKSLPQSQQAGGVPAVEAVLGVVVASTPPGRWLIGRSAWLLMKPFEWAGKSVYTAVGAAARGATSGISALNCGARAAQALHVAKDVGNTSIPGGNMIAGAAKLQRWNSGITGLWHGFNYATGERPLDYDNVSSSVAQVAPLAASGLVAAGFLIADQVVARGINYVTTGDASSMTDVMNDTTRIDHQGAGRFMPAEIHPQFRRSIPSAHYEGLSTPRMADYKYLAAIRHELPRLLPKNADVSILARFDSEDMTRHEHYLRYEALLDAALAHQQALQQNNSSIFPIWLRGSTFWKSDNEVHAFNDAESNLGLLKAVKTELQAFKQRAEAYQRVLEQAPAEGQVAFVSDSSTSTAGTLLPPTTPGLPLGASVSQQVAKGGF